MERAEIDAIHRLWLPAKYGYTNFMLKKQPKIDRRTTYGKAVLRFMDKHKEEILSKIDERSIIAKRKKRRENQPTPILPIKERPIIKDWLANRSMCTAIYNDHLEFGIRRHWGKTKSDGLFLELLQKYHPEKAKYI